MKILKSLVIVLAMAALVSTATSAFFTDQAVVSGNTFATGILDISATGSAWDNVTIAGNMKPGDTITKQFNIINNGWNTEGNFGFDGQSTLSGKLYLTASQTAGESILYNAVNVKVTRLQWGEVVVYNGALSGLVNIDGQAVLPVGWTQQYKVEITLPEIAGNDLQGKTATFNFIVDATTQGT